MKIIGVNDADLSFGCIGRIKADKGTHQDHKIFHKTLHGLLLVNGIQNLITIQRCLGVVKTLVVKPWEFFMHSCPGMGKSQRDAR